MQPTPTALAHGPHLCAVLAIASCTRADDEKLTVPALGEPVEILRDQWGVSHIYARNEHDLFLAQGYFAARDRLFQLELWRRQATGTLAEILGPRGLLPDIGARLLRFRGDMKRELGHYHPRGNEIVTSFVAGINAFIELTEREPERLPLEFKILGIKPGKWTPEVVVSRHNGLFRNVTQEVQYAQLVHLMGSQRTRRVPQSSSRASAPRARSFCGPVRDRRPVFCTLTWRRAQRSGSIPMMFSRSIVIGTASVRKTAALVDPGHAVSHHGSPHADPVVEGSNNWVVSGGHTLSGHAIMANDPHRSVQLPSLRYWVHLVAPGWNVIGAGEPALPGVSVGHNERGAWGFTIFPIDQEDLYVYETDPGDPTRYRYGDGWEAMKTVHETIEVKGRPKADVDLRYTRHGPVIYEDRPHHKAYALRAAWLEEGTAPTLRACGSTRPRAGPSSARRAARS